MPAKHMHVLQSSCANKVEVLHVFKPYTSQEKHYCVIEVLHLHLVFMT